jgi:hypothetical protein
MGHRGQERSIRARDGEGDGALGRKMGIVDPEKDNTSWTGSHEEDPYKYNRQTETKLGYVLSFLQCV